MVTRTNRVVLGAAAAAFATGGVLAQPGLELATTDAQVALVDRIAESRVAGGPTAAAAIDPLRALALAYQVEGDDALAIGVLEEARYVTRVHYGLSSPEEALLLRQQIRSEKALANDQRVWDLEQDMVTIARRNLDDARMVPIFRELADDRSDALREYRAGMLPPEIYLGCYYSVPPGPYADPRGERRPPVGSDSGCRSGSSSSVVANLRTEIALYYADAIEVIVKNGEYGSQELRDLERESLRFAFGRTAPRCPTSSLGELLQLEILGSCLEPVIHLNDIVIANVGGWASLIRLIAYEVRNGAPPQERAKALADLADWHTLTAHRDRRSFAASDASALAIYQAALQELAKGTATRDAMAQIFAPELPIVLPTFEPNPLATAESPRYIDATFAVTSRGKAQRVKILDTGRGASNGEERDLIRLLENASFRPRAVDGRLADAAPVTLRYYLSR